MLISTGVTGDSQWYCFLDVCHESWSTRSNCQFKYERYNRTMKSHGQKSHGWEIPLHAGSGTRAHPEKRQSRKAAMERSSRKAAKPPWNAQAAKPQSCHGTRKPQSRKAAMERASRKAAKPQIAMERASRKAAKPPWNAQAAKPPSRKAAEPQALRLMRRLLRSSPLRCHRHGPLKPQSRKLWDAGAVSCVHRRCVARASRSVKEPQSAEASKHHEASKRQSFKKRQSVKKRQSFKKRHSAEASKSRQRKAGCA